ncbi:MAG TPA: hypothetical protein VI818_05730, partial [Candidatus Thermoplasmatota archaeon]|nr:hypothetical protein [Candidatus Thermoplasmatota archaeon]
MPIWLTVLLVVVLAAAVFESLLAIFVLRRAQGNPAGRWLAAFMILHGFAFADLSVGMFLTFPDGSDTYLDSMNVGFVLLAASTLPMLLFALHHPTSVHPAAQWVAGLLATVPAVTVVWFALAEASGWRFAFHPSPTEEVSAAATAPVAFIVLLLMSVITTQVLRVRRRNATTALERRRMGYPMWGLGIPLILAALSLIGSFGLSLYLITTQIDSQADADRWTWIFIAMILPGFLGLALVPPFSTAYGLLRFRMLDIDLRLRITIRRGFVASVFFAVFLTAAQIAEFVIQNRVQSTVAGVLAMLPLFLLLHPIQRLADRVAGRAMPGAQDSEKYREFRRWEIYRATFEDVSRDGVVTPPERRTLEALAKSLSLDWKAVEGIENQVRRERQG